MVFELMSQFDSNKHTLPIEDPRRLTSFHSFVLPEIGTGIPCFKNFSMRLHNHTLIDCRTFSNDNK